MKSKNALMSKACKALDMSRRLRRSESGQGTVEYAVLVGVLVVIAIAAIVLFRDKVTSLWSAISEGINGL